LIVGLVSDTHGLVRPEALAALAGSDHILHAGDIGAPEVLEAFRRIAPVTAVRGNNDRGPWAEAIPEREMLELGGAWFYLLHDLAELDIDPAAAGVQVVVAGHSHKPAREERDGVIYVNPGSAGPRRFKLPVSVARVVVEKGRAEASLDLLQTFA
jgi:uncharacterized protein